MDIAKQRLWNEHLVGPPLASAEEVVRWLCAVQSQDYPAAKWGVAQRTKGLTSTDFDKLYNEGKILRTHVMRPTWHFVTPEDILWMEKLTAPRVQMLMKHYDRLLDLDDKLYQKSNTLIGNALAGNNYLTRSELAEVLAKAGIKTKVQRLAHIVSHAELDGIICSGPLRGKQFTYALLSERAPKAKSLEHDEALSKLAGRYIVSHGPALVQDFSWWSGLTIAESKKALELAKPQLVTEVIDGQTYWFSPTQTTPKNIKPSLHLLPNYDEFLIAYKGYGSIFNAAHFPPNAIDSLRSHIIVKDGQVIGGWKRTIVKNQITIHPTLFAKLTKTERAALQAAAKAYEKFTGLTVTIDA